jgi:hypothetical protein
LGRSGSGRGTSWESFDIANSFHRSARCPHFGLKEDSRKSTAKKWASTLSADRMRPLRSSDFTMHTVEAGLNLQNNSMIQ